MPRIFERFCRVEEARSRASKETGLGPSIVRYRVRALGASWMPGTSREAEPCFTSISREQAALLVRNAGPEIEGANPPAPSRGTARTGRA